MPELKGYHSGIHENSIGNAYLLRTYMKKRIKVWKGACVVNKLIHKFWNTEQLFSVRTGSRKDEL